MSSLTEVWYLSAKPFAAPLKDDLNKWLEKTCKKLCKKIQAGKLGKPLEWTNAINNGDIWCEVVGLTMQCPAIKG